MLLSFCSFVCLSNCLTVNHLKRVHKNAIFLKTKQFKVVGSVDYQYRKSFVGFTKNPFLNYRITVSDSKPLPVTHSNPRLKFTSVKFVSAAGA